MKRGTTSCHSKFRFVRMLSGGAIGGVTIVTR